MNLYRLRNWDDRNLLQFSKRNTNLGRSNPNLRSWSPDQAAANQLESSFAKKDLRVLVDK